MNATSLNLVHRGQARGLTQLQVDCSLSARFADACLLDPVPSRSPLAVPTQMASRFVSTVGYLAAGVHDRRQGLFRAAHIFE